MFSDYLMHMEDECPSSNSDRIQPSLVSKRLCCTFFYYSSIFSVYSTAYCDFISNVFLKEMMNNHERGKQSRVT